VLLSDGGQDLVWPSAPSATQIVQELRRSADREPCTSLGGSEQASALAAEQF
jgi:hypothetical protein